MPRHHRYVLAFVMLSLPVLTLFQNCTDNFAIKAGDADLASLSASATCDFNGSTVPSGQSVAAFLTSTVPYGQTCPSQDRICDNGQLSGTYSFGSCTVDGPMACLFDGKTIPHEQSVYAYEKSSVPYGESCMRQARVCNNGALLGSYTFATCEVAAAKSCMFNGQTVASGNTVTAYSSSTVPYGKTCLMEKRKCVDGQLSGTYTFGTCEVNGPAACMFNGKTIASGQSVLAYKDAVVPYGEQCVSEQRNCVNGVLSGTYGKDSCTITICDPFTNPSATCTSTTNGLKGKIWYQPAALVATEGGWKELATFYERGTVIDATLKLSQLNVPAEIFSVGFPIGNNEYLSDSMGNRLVEWFALQVDGLLRLAPGDQAGEYEFATLTDDGSKLFLRDASTGQLVQRINNDGHHSVRLGCIDKPVYMSQTTQLPMRLQYFQGPRTVIALRMLYRLKSATAESLCGKTHGSGAEFYVKSGSGNPYPEGPSMQQLYNNGWRVLGTSNFLSP